MSFNTHKEVVENGDTVILYVGREKMLTFLVDPSKTHQTKYGAFDHQDLIGKRFGTKVYSKNDKGWVYLLHPSPEFWTVTLPHRTQILYTTDISLITMELQLKPGSIVVETGTGSGSLSHAIIRTIKPNGHLHTFDFHQQRVEKAREEFKQHGVGEFVTCKCADACKDGFSLDSAADAVFLDLPAPWNAVENAKKTLKASGGRFCSFSPCIEQVQRTCAFLRRHKFCEIKTVECLLQTLQVKTIHIPEARMGSTYARADATFGKENTVDDMTSPAEPALKKSKVSEDELCETDETKHSSKTKSLCRAVFLPSAKDMNDLENTQTLAGVGATGLVTRFSAQEKSGHINYLTSKPTKEMPGHTGYLTFASFYPAFKP